MKFVLSVLLSFFLAMQGCAQPGFDVRYAHLKSASKVQDKDFYLFTLMEAPVCRAALQRDTLFAAKTAYYRGIVSQLDTPGKFIRR
jgi:hypothetical protein